MGNQNDKNDWLTLALIPGIGTTHFIRLLARFHTPSEILGASESSLCEVVSQKLARRITQYSEVVDLQQQLRLMQEYQVSLVTLDDAAYPLLLGEIYDPPLALFCRGDLTEADRYSVAIVGTRKASPYGIRMAEKLGRDLAFRGITVVSGMASGVDTAAHRGALEAGGRTIAVLGCGVNIVYPKQNVDLMQDIIQSGSVISQFPMDAPPSKTHFPIRNRIISGITLGTVVVQAPQRSGALITAHSATEQGREVFAVPGEIGNRNSEGPHTLIREGAKLVESVEDVLAELSLPAEMQIRPVLTDRREEAPVKKPARKVSAPESIAASTSQEPIAEPEPAPPASVTKEERHVLSVLAPNGSFVDEIAAACRISVAEALSALTMLEIKGWVRQFSGKRFAPR
jgi:DNA processing protein